MSVRPALLVAAALAAAFYASLVLFRWGAGGNGGLLDIVTEVERGEELESHVEAGQCLHEARRALAAEVVAGRMSLCEAADHFHRLDDGDPAYPAGLPGPPRDERFFCEWVLDFVWQVLARKEFFATAARWYGEAFTDHPHLLAGPPAGQRYYTARAAARAGCGQGRDAAGLDEKSRGAFRRQALDWLRAALEARQRLLEQDLAKPPWQVAYDLDRWLGDPGFAGLREPEALARLPEAERQAWHQLWVDVADTLARAWRTTVREQQRLYHTRPGLGWSGGVERVPPR
jgi:hypothetical protein